MNEELESLNNRNTWEILNKPENVKCIANGFIKLR